MEENRRKWNKIEQNGKLLHGREWKRLEKNFHRYTK